MWLWTPDIHPDLPGRAVWHAASRDGERLCAGDVTAGAWLADDWPPFNMQAASEAPNRGRCIRFAFYWFAPV